MIFFGRFTSSFVAKIIGILQVMIAIVITALGITITLKFANIHHEKNSEYDHAIDYVNNPWTTKYGAGIWMGLLMCIAGALGTFTDLKPAKTKYTYGFLILNSLVLVLGIILVVFSVKAIDWYQHCTFIEQLSNGGKLIIRECSSKDKATGRDLYTGVLITLVFALIVTIIAIVLTAVQNRILFSDWCTGGCLRRLVYKAKGARNTAMNFKTKNTHEFNQVSVGPQSFSPSHNAQQQDENGWVTNAYV